MEKGTRLDEIDLGGRVVLLEHETMDERMF